MSSSLDPTSGVVSIVLIPKLKGGGGMSSRLDLTSGVASIVLLSILKVEVGCQVV